jgi:hypothetical protein
MINVSFCSSHRKGGDAPESPFLDGELHWRWLEEALVFLESQAPWDIFVSVIGFTGFEHHKHTAIWRIFDRDAVRLLFSPANPGHQQGAALAIWLGLEAAHHLDYKYMVHTAEDIVPDPGAMMKMVEWMDGSHVDYIGEAWGWSRTELSAQFFACRVEALRPVFDPGQVLAHGYIERYLRDKLANNPKEFTENMFRHTHSFEEWQRWTKEPRKN